MDRECDWSGLTVRSCDHCRKTGAYVPQGETGLHLDAELKLSIDGLGVVYLESEPPHGTFVNADEGLLRGKFGRGKKLF